MIINNIYTNPSTPAPTPPPSYIIIAPAPTPVPTPTLSQEVTQFTINFIIAGSNSPFDEASYYAEAATYFNKGTIRKQAILDDINQYDARWPIRSYQIVEGPAIYWINDLTAESVLIGNFSAINSSKSVSGTFKETILIRIDMWKIIGVDSQILEKVTHHNKY